MDSEFELQLGRINSLSYFERRLEIRRFVNPIQSRFLYKYRAIDPYNDESIDRVRDIVVRSRLWLSSPFDFNDPFDMSAKFVIQGTEQERRERFIEILTNQGISRNDRKLRLKNMMKKSRKSLENELAGIYKNRADGVGIYSFAGDPRNILMWSHYSRDHSGVCLQFERAKDFLTMSGAIKVEYAAEYPVINL